LDRVLAQGRRLQELISDLLLLANLERPCDEAQKQVCDLAEITTDVLEDFGESAAAAHISLIQTSWLPAGRVLGLESELSRLVINLLSNAILEPFAGVQKRKDHSAQGIPRAKDELIKSKGTTNIHQAAAVTTDAIDDGENYPYFDSGCTTVLTSSMRNCREVEQHVVQISQAESGVQMMSAHPQVQEDLLCRSPRWKYSFL
jgi:hypothetical protein